MQYEVEIAGRLLQVAVTRAGDGFAVTVDGRTRQVDAARIDAHTLSLLVDTVWSKEVSIAADAVSGQLTMHVGATAGDRDAERPPPLGPERTKPPATSSGPQAPRGADARQGRACPRESGDLVAARQPVVVVEQ